MMIADGGLKLKRKWMKLSYLYVQSRLYSVFIMKIPQFLLSQINWTVLYRRKHRKGMVEEAAKKRTRRTQKFMRAVTGATLQDIMAKRNQKPEVRKAQR